VFQLVPGRQGYGLGFVYIFQGSPDGANPAAGLIADKSGALYGPTYYGGAWGIGSVFKFTPSGSGYTETILYSFQGGADGYGPRAALTADAAGALYGTTANGGSSACTSSFFSGCGTVFKLTP
jgi:uncharacterized repeat protein (TIGR03803 family)